MLCCVELTDYTVYTVLYDCSVMELATYTYILWYTYILNQQTDRWLGIFVYTRGGVIGIGT